MAWSVAGLAVLIVAGVAWVGIRGWQAKGELEAAVPLASKVQDQFASGDIDAATGSARSLVAHARSAKELTGDPVWRIAELTPFVGGNLTAFREAAEVTNSVASDAVFPLISDVSKIGVESFRPANGTVNLQPLVDAAPTVASARAVLAAADSKAQAINTDGTIGQVADAVGKLRDSVSKADGLIQGVDRAVTLVPRMLGAEGPRNYLLLFQNPAELRAGGGITSALAQISTENGSVALTQQASSEDFPRYASPVIALPPETEQLFSSRAATYVQNTTLVPEFNLSGQIASQMWTDQFGTSVDGVISFDPVALSYLLKATGPVVLTDGFELTSDNAVKFLLSDVYSKYQDPAVQDAVFAEAAKSIFDAVAKGDLDPAKLLDALAKSGAEGRFKIWSSHEEDQAVLAGTTLAGELPPITDDSTGIGVYFNDATGAKMDYYLSTGVATQSELCRADGRPSFRISLTLTNTAPADAATSLPRYVTGGGGFGVAPGNVSTIAYIYGPTSVGELTDATIVTNLDPGIEGGSANASIDSGHTVAVFPVELAPGESRTVTVDFLGQKGNPLQISPQITPTIVTTVYSTEINTGFSGC